MLQDCLVSVVVRVIVSWRMCCMRAQLQILTMIQCRSAPLDDNNMCIGMEGGILDDASTCRRVRTRGSSNVFGDDLRP
jgi:hypothetical protein